MGIYKFVGARVLPKPRRCETTRGLHGPDRPKCSLELTCDPTRLTIVEYAVLERGVAHALKAGENGERREAGVSLGPGSPFGKYDQGLVRLAACQNYAVTQAG